MSVILDSRYSKDRILEVYLNEVYLGQRGSVAICGVQAASRYFFGRNVSDLSLAEAATLAGLIRNPGGYNPFAHPDRAVERRNVVLDAMLELGLADKEAVARGESRAAAGRERGRRIRASAVRRRLRTRTARRALSPTRCSRRTGWRSTRPSTRSFRRARKKRSNVAWSGSRRTFRSSAGKRHGTGCKGASS